MIPPTLDMWVVYNNPLDFPGYYVARLFVIFAGSYQATNVVRVRNTLEQVRRSIPDGLTRIERYPNDEPHIVEVWM